MRSFRQLSGVLVLSIFALLFTVACGGQQPAEEAPAEEAAAEQPQEPEDEGPVVATAELQAAEGSEISGTVTFSQLRGGSVTVQAEVEGVEGAGLHGIHIHEEGDCSAADFTSAGGHFNPTDAPHACPPTTPRHAGDMGNLEIGEDGTGSMEASLANITLEQGAESYIVGKAVILHAGEDDCETQPTGDAGARLACGVIQAGP